MTITEYINQYTGEHKAWLEEFVAYMDKKAMAGKISYNIIMYKLPGDKNHNFVAFSVAKEHFSLHTLDFEYIVELKAKLKKPGRGKGCVNVPFKNSFEKPTLYKAVDDIINRNLFV